MVSEAENEAVRPRNGSLSRGSRVYRSLVSDIRARLLRPGDRVREETVAATLGVSRTPVREAFTRLQARGLLEATQGGLAVASLSRPQVMEIYAMRARLEGDAAAFAAENASAGEVAAIRHAASFFEGQEMDAERTARANMLFHLTIYEAAHNRYLMRMLEDLNDSLALLPETTFSVPGRAAAARAEHRAVLQAIEARQPDKAEKAARAHIGRALEARLQIAFSIEAPQDI